MQTRNESVSTGAKGNYLANFTWIKSVESTTGPKESKKCEGWKRLLFATDSIQLTGPDLTVEALEGFGDFRIEGQVIRAVKYADDLVAQAEEKVIKEDSVEWK